MRLIFGFAFLMATILTSQVSQAAIVLTLTPQGSTTVVQGTDLVFDVFMRSNHVSPNPAPNLLSVSVNLQAGAGDGSNGSFDIVNSTTSLPGADPWTPFGPGQVLGGKTDFAGFTVANSDVLLGTLVLDTATSNLGTFNLSFFDLATADFVTSLDIGISGNTVQYTITAVPEPTSMALVGLIGGVVGFRRWRKMASKA